MHQSVCARDLCWVDEVEQKDKSDVLSTRSSKNEDKIYQNLLHWQLQEQIRLCVQAVVKESVSINGNCLCRTSVGYC